MTEAQKRELGKLIKEAKGSRTLDRFAEETGISKFQISRIINGRYEYCPHMSTIAKIAKFSELNNFVERFKKIATEEIFEANTNGVH